MKEAEIRVLMQSLHVEIVHYKTDRLGTESWLRIKEREFAIKVLQKVLGNGKN